MTMLDSISKQYCSTFSKALTFCSKGEKVTAKAHGGSIDIQGITIAKVDDKVRLQAVETWFDPMEMFRQIAPAGIVSKILIAAVAGQDLTALLHGESEDEKAVATGDRDEVAEAHEEMSRLTLTECPFMNSE